MKILVTAGNTQTPIDRVRCITNNFTGRTGAGIALAAATRGHHVTLTTSHPETMAAAPDACRVLPYRTFDDLQALLATLLMTESWDAVIHAAAINDYHAAGVYAPAPGTAFDAARACWTDPAGAPRLVERTAAKVKSDEPELWLRLVRAPKLVDAIRGEWGFRGVLVKFKLEVDKTDAELLESAEHSRRQSAADWMVANTLADAAHWALLGPFADGYHKIARAELPARLLDAVCGTAK